MKCKILKARPGTQVMSDEPGSHLNIVVRKRKCRLKEESRGEKAQRFSRIASVEIEVPKHFTRCYEDENRKKVSSVLRIRENPTSPTKNARSPKVDVESPTSQGEAYTFCFSSLVVIPSRGPMMSFRKFPMVDRLSEEVMTNCVRWWRRCGEGG